MRTLETMRSKAVTFCSSVNYCELAIESTDNLYVVRFWKNGNITYSHNCRIVSFLPKSPLVTRLLAAVEKHMALISCYLETDDINTRKELFWSIKGKLEA